MNAVSMALMSAGIMMTDMIAACSVGYLKQQACQDVTQVEESSGAACMPVAIKTRYGCNRKVNNSELRLHIAVSVSV